MEAWHIWAIIALIFLIIEISTTGFAFFCIALGCVASTIAAVFTTDIKIQIIVFIVTTLASIVFIRPVLKRFFFKKKEILTNADALIGRTATVSEEIDNENNSGRIAVDGDDWKAVSENGEIIKKGEHVKIVSRDSIILTVKKQ